MDMSILKTSILLINVQVLNYVSYPFAAAFYSSNLRNQALIATSRKKLKR